MIVLAVDTATPQVGVALRGDDGPIGSLHASPGRRHAEVLAPAIRDLCAHTGVELGEVGLVAVDVGPGLFTGLRVGLATAKALASALEVPALGYTSLAVLARPHRQVGTPVAAVVDVRRREVAWALYGAATDAQPGEMRPPAIASSSDLAESLSALDVAVLAVGDGAERYHDELSAVPGVDLGGPDDAFPSAAVLARMAHEQAGAAGDARLLTPVYLRQADVRIGWAQAPSRPRPAEAGAPGGGDRG